MEKFAIWCIILMVVANGCGRESGTAPAQRNMTPAAGKELTVELGNGVKLEMVLIPTGEFMMGLPGWEKDFGNEKPQHRVRITKPFYLGKYLVTQEQWEAVIGQEPKPVQGSEESGGTSQLGRLPAVSRKAQREVHRWGRKVPVAHRSTVGKGTKWEMQ